MIYQFFPVYRKTSRPGQATQQLGGNAEKAYEAVHLVFHTLNSRTHLSMNPKILSRILSNFIKMAQGHLTFYFLTNLCIKHIFTQFIHVYTHPFMHLCSPFPYQRCCLALPSACAYTNVALTENITQNEINPGMKIIAI